MDEGQYNRYSWEEDEEYNSFMRKYKKELPKELRTSLEAWWTAREI